MKYCINCGSKTEESDSFCINCGHKIDSTFAEPAALTHQILKEKKIEHPRKKLSHREMMLIFILLAIVFVLIAIGVLSNTPSLNTNKQEQTNETSNWTEFSSPDGKFKASFPVYPTHTNQTIETTNMEIYGAENSDGTIKYDVVIIQVPAIVDVSIPENMLKGVLNNSLQNDKS